MDEAKALRELLYDARAQAVGSFSSNPCGFCGGTRAPFAKRHDHDPECVVFRIERALAGFKPNPDWSCPWAAPVAAAD